MSSDLHPSFRLPGKKPHIISLMLLSAFASMGAILMMPALPQMANHFSIKINTAQLAVTSFLLGYAIGQLIYGPLANRYGRKIALYIGIVIASIGSIFSIFSSPFDSFSLLILGRFLEAIGSCAGFAVCFTIINDFYYEKEARKITAVLMLAFAIVPGIGIALGGFLVQFLHWQSCFYFLLIYGFVLLYFAYRLPETLQSKDLSAVKLKTMLKNYRLQFCIKKLISFAMIGGFSGACVYVFGAEGPYIGIHLLHISPAIYGSMGLLPYIGTLLGSVLLLKLSSKDILKIMRYGYVIEVFATVLMLILFLLHEINILTLLLPMFLFCFGTPFISGTITVLAMQQSEDKANASAVMSFTLVSMPVLLTYLLTIFPDKSPLVMPLLFIFALVVMFILGFYNRN